MTEAVTDDRPPSMTVSSSEAIELLCNAKAITVLMAFLHAPHTLTTAAAALQRPVSTVAYWIPRFARCGLIEPRRAIARAGSAMTEWQAPARQLVVRITDLPFDARVRFMDGARYRIMRRFLDGVDEVMTKGGQECLGFSSVDEPRSMRIEIVEDDAQREERGYSDLWGTMMLDEADAKRLGAEMEALVAKYAERPGRKEHVLHCGIVPVPVVKWRSAADDAPTRRD